MAVVASQLVSRRSALRQLVVDFVMHCRGQVEDFRTTGDASSVQKFKALLASLAAGPVTALRPRPARGVMEKAPSSILKDDVTVRS
jgi:hypothetical protein